MHALDRPVWASLTTHHVPLSEGNELARRFARDVNLFASARDDTPDAVAELARLVKPGETVFILQVPEIVIPSGLVEVKANKIWLTADVEVNLMCGGSLVRVDQNGILIQGTTVKVLQR